MANASWEGIELGDVVQYKDRQFLFRGMNNRGGPGMNGKPDPVFGMPRPSATYEFFISYYLRNKQNQPEGIPENMLESAPPMKLGHLNYASFLNATRTDLEKIKHVSETEWKSMMEDLQKKIGADAQRAVKVIAKALEDRDYYMPSSNPHLSSRSSPVFGAGGCGCGCAPSFQFYLDENMRIGISLPLLYGSNFWHDDEQRTKQRGLEQQVKNELNATEVVMIVGEDKKPNFLEPFFVR